MNLDSIINSNTNTVDVNPLATNSATRKKQLKTMYEVRRIDYSILFMIAKLVR